MNALFAYRGERLVQCVKDVISADNVAPAVALQIGIRSAYRDSPLRVAITPNAPG